MEEGTAPDEWVTVEMPAGLILADICDALGLSTDETRQVLGDAGAEFLELSLSDQISV